MRKVLFLIIFLLVSISSFFAKDVDVKHASAVGLNFYYEHLNAIRKTDYSSLTITNTFVETLDNKAIYYTFNISGKGFIMVAADDNVQPILGYSFECTYNNANNPPQFVYWMKKFKTQIDYCKKNKITETEEIRAIWDKYSQKPDITNSAKDIQSLLPLLTSTWNQPFPYNEFCPEDSAGPGGHALVGCVAVAMGQVMDYYKYPKHGTSSHTYNDYTYGNLTANFGNTNYDWYAIPNYANGSNPALATLLYHCGVAVEMGYGATASGANTYDVPNALTNYFGYTWSVVENRNDYSDAAWINLVKSYLDTKDPMYYSGFDPNNGGHAYVCDGYQGTDFFHFNWGWGGSSNGYFYMSDLNPSGYHFNDYQQLVVSEPGTDYPFFCSSTQTVTANQGVLFDGSGKENYQDNQDCSWLLAPSDDIKSITLTFTSFDLEVSDSVIVYDGANAAAPELAKYSGTSIPPAVTSSGAKMFVRFITSSTGNNEGWEASFTSSYFIFCNATTILTSQSDTLSDGSGSRTYNNNAYCRWKIQPTGASSITLTFNSFDTEPVNDWVKIYDMSVSPSILLGEFSGSTIPAPVTCNSSAMMVMFKSNATTRSEGWTASYSSVLTTIDNVDAKDLFSVYPNPAEKHFTINLENFQQNQAYCELYSYNGELIYTQKLSELSTKVDCSNISKGVYLLRISYSESMFSKILLIN